MTFLEFGENWEVTEQSATLEAGDAGKGEDQRGAEAPEPGTRETHSRLADRSASPAWGVGGAYS